MIKRLLFLDDIRTPSDCVSYMGDWGIDVNIYQGDWFIVRSYDEFTNWITLNGLPDIISFDHDLGDMNGENELTGMDCAKWLVNYCIDYNVKLPEFIIHSANPSGRVNIKGLLVNFRDRYFIS